MKTPTPTSTSSSSTLVNGKPRQRASRKQMDKAAGWQLAHPKQTQADTARQFGVSESGLATRLSHIRPGKSPRPKLITSTKRRPIRRSLTSTTKASHPHATSPSSLLHIQWWLLGYIEHCIETTCRSTGLSPRDVTKWVAGQLASHPSGEILGDEG